MRTWIRSWDDFPAGPNNKRNRARRAQKKRRKARLALIATKRTMKANESLADLLLSLSQKGFGTFRVHACNASGQSWLIRDLLRETEAKLKVGESEDGEYTSEARDGKLVIYFTPPKGDMKYLAWAE